MKNFRKIFYLIFILICYSCVSTGTLHKISFSEYVLSPGPDQTQNNAGIEISMKVIRLSEIYAYPQFFSFSLDNFPEPYKSNGVLRGEYRPGMDGKSWEFPFATPDGKFQLLFCFCKVKNNTKHILRMGDARIYFIIEGIDPLPAISSFEGLLEQADYFEFETNKQRSKETALIILQNPPLPTGFFRRIVVYNRRAYNLINDLKHEILPGFSYEGIIVFPAMPSLTAPAKISFFDVTISTDKAGNPTEKTQIDFKLQSQFIQMYYDTVQKKWVVGNPPEIKQEDINPPMPGKSGQNIQNDNSEKTDKNISPKIDNLKKPQEGAMLLIVKASTANIRKEPSLSAQIITTVSQGTQLKVVGIEGEWYEIVIEDKTGILNGYIHQSVIEIKKYINNLGKN